MHINRGSIDGLIGVHVRSILKWGYQDNFKTDYYYIYIFFYENVSRVQKAPKRKTSDFHPFKSLCAWKIVAFVLLVNVCLWVFLCVRNLFVKKINRLEIFLITSLHFTTSKKFIKKMFFFSLLFLSRDHSVYQKLLDFKKGRRCIFISFQIFFLKDHSQRHLG